MTNDMCILQEKIESGMSKLFYGGTWMYGLKGRIYRLISELHYLLNENKSIVEDIEIRKGRITFPCNVSSICDGFQPYLQGDVWSGTNFDDYALFKFKVNLPIPKEDYHYFLNQINYLITNSSVMKSKD